MRKLVPWLALLALPAQAQDASLYYASDSWPVYATGGTCTMRQPGGLGLSVGYDPARGEVALATLGDVTDALPQAGSLDMVVVFLDNRGEPYDDAWGARRFDYARENGSARFTTRFAGEKNVRQILADLANSRAVGFKYRNEPALGHDLTGARASLAKLQECAERAVAGN